MWDSNPLSVTNNINDLTCQTYSNWIANNVRQLTHSSLSAREEMRLREVTSLKVKQVDSDIVGLEPKAAPTESL